MYNCQSRGSVGSRANHLQFGRTVIRQAAILALGGLAVVTGSAQAGDHTSTVVNGGTKNWSNPNSWTPAGVPNNGANTYDVVFNTATYGGTTLNLDEDITVDSFSLTGGFLSGGNSPAASHTLTLNNALNWSSGIIGSNGLTVILKNGGTIAATATCEFGVGTIENRGTLTYTANFTSTPDGKYPIRFDSNGTINNIVGATFNIAGDASISVAGAGNVINNSGTFVKSAGTGTSVVQTAFTDTGTTLVQSGTLQFIGGASTHSGTVTALAGTTINWGNGTRTFTSTCNLGGDGAIQFGGDILNFGGKLLGGASPLQVVNGSTTFVAGCDITSLGLPVGSGGRALELDGPCTTAFNTGSTVSIASLTTTNKIPGNTLLVLNGSDDLKLTGPVTWSGGQISGAITSPINTVFVNGGMTITGSGMALDHRRLQNNSTIDQLGLLQAKNGSVIENSSSGTFNIGSIGWGPTMTGFALPSITNAGTINSGGDALIMDVRLTNTGLLHVTGGILTLNHGASNGNFVGQTDTGVNSGVYQIDQDGTLIVADHTMDASSTVRGAGTMQFGANNNTVAGTYNMTGQTNVTAGGVAFVAGATVTNVGQTLNIMEGGGASFDTGHAITLHDVIDNGIITGSDLITVDGKLSGSGSFNVNLVAPGTISPGNSPGILAVQGSLTMKPTTTTVMELGGHTNNGSTPEFDQITATGSMTLDGDIVLTLVDGYVPDPTDILTLIADSGQLAGAFANITSGQRLLTSDGEGTFLVTYNAGNVIVSDFQAVPEPTIAALLATTVPLLARRRR